MVACVFSGLLTRGYSNRFSLEETENMKTNYIWLEETLLKHTKNPKPEIREWAVETLFNLYPQLARERTGSFLQSQDDTIVRCTLQQLDENRQDELVPILKDIYLSGSPEASALAIYRLGEWEVPEAVFWIQERILEGSPLSGDQIKAMLFALGALPGENSYRLLKDTEEAVRDGKPSLWEVFYASLLKHGKREDVETLIKLYLDPTSSEDLGRKALGLLLARTDPTLNPSDVLFGNHSAVQRHFKNRLNYLSGLEGAKQDENVVRSIGTALELAERVSETGTAREIGERLGDLVSEFPDGQGYGRDIPETALGHLKEGDLGDDKSFALTCLAFSSMLDVLANLVDSGPSEGSPWEEKLEDLLRDRFSRPSDRLFEEQVMREADPAELLSRLSSAIRDNPESWGAIRAITMAGRLGAVEIADTIIETVKRRQSEILLDAAGAALVQMGPDVAPKLLPLLDTGSPVLRGLALQALSRVPTAEAVGAILDRFPKLLETDPELSLDAARRIAAQDFLPFIEKEYRPGEWAVGRVFVHIAAINGVSPSRLKEIEQDVKRGDQFYEQHRKLLEGSPTQWPSSIDLELACRACGKRFHYQVNEVHLHPYESSGSSTESMEDWAPYRYGVVICDDLRCKNCRQLNQLELTRATLAQITTESLKLLAFQRSGLSVPQYYPVKRVQVSEKEGKPVTLVSVEQEHIDATLKHPEKPQGHLALGKFYEYVKQFPQARESYLKALDMDSGALEAMAGLARLYHAEGKAEEAYDWIDRCYGDLSRGRFYLTENPRDFKKVVREKRREFARELGIQPKEEPVEVRFKVDTPDYPKNSPCPCGSGKKYKLCCMGKK